MCRQRNRFQTSVSGSQVLNRRKLEFASQLRSTKWNVNSIFSNNPRPEVVLEKEKQRIHKYTHVYLGVERETMRLSSFGWANIMSNGLCILLCNMRNLAPPTSHTACWKLATSQKLCCIWATWNVVHTTKNSEISLDFDTAMRRCECQNTLSVIIIRGKSRQSIHKYSDFQPKSEEVKKKREKSLQQHFASIQRPKCLN